MLKQWRALRSHQPLFYAMLLASMLLVLAPFGASQAKAQVATPAASTNPPPAVVYGPGKLHMAPSQAWLQAKNEHRIVKRGKSVTTLAATPLISYPGIWLLDEGVSGSIYEPPPTSTDALGHAYDDGYYGNFCSAGASTVVMSYWFNVNVAGWPAGNFTEPASATRRTTTYWNDTDDRAYLMYMAEQVLVPGWAYGGVVTFQTYPHAYAATGDITNALNWEASGHSSNWQNYYYGTYGIGSLTQAQLNSDIMSDILWGWSG